jgi:hypothetical protein
MIPARHLIENSQKIQCREGWIYYKPLEGRRYYVTATGYRAETISALELSGYLRELTQALGGKVMQRAAESKEIVEAFMDDKEPEPEESFDWMNWDKAQNLPLIRFKDRSYWRIDTAGNVLYNDDDPDHKLEFGSAQELTDYLEPREDKTYHNVGSQHKFTSHVYKDPDPIPLDKKLVHEVFRYGDFAVLLIPHDEQFIRREGFDMQHCLISAYHSYCERAKAKEIELFSLIDLKDGDPKVDIEVALTISSYSGRVPHPVVFQIRGKRNECPPKDEYIPALMAFFNSYGKQHDWKLTGHGFRNFDGKVDGDLLVKRGESLPPSS